MARFGVPCRADVGNMFDETKTQKTLQKGEKFVKKFIGKKNENQKTLDLDRYSELENILIKLNEKLTINEDLKI